MGLKDKFVSKIPEAYILHKTRDKQRARLIIKGYRAIRKYNLFDDEFYLNSYPKVRNSNMDPLLHYLYFGFKEGKRPNKTFDALFYKYNYDDVNINPLIHYALYGLAENRQIKPENNLEGYKKSNKKRIIYILHEKIGTIGGTGFTNLDIIEGLGDSYERFILTSTGEELELWIYGEEKLEKIYHEEINFSNDFSRIDESNKNRIISDDFENQIYNSKLATIYEEILDKLDVDIVHINHLINHSFDLIDVIIKKNIPYLLSVHDFYYICPSIHLINENCQYCNFDCENCHSFNIDKEENSHKILDIWQKSCYNILKNAEYVIFPSNSAIGFYDNVFNSLDNFKLIEHGRDLEKTSSKFSLPDEKPIKIVFPGHISPHKGSLLIREIKKLDKDNKLEFHFVGTTIPNLKKYGINHGRYERGEFNSIISKIRPSFIAILSVCPETYSHTLTESIASGIPVVATDLGALKERIEEYGVGWLVNPQNPLDIYNKLISISNEDYLNKIDALSKVKIKSKEEMINQYIGLYNGIMGDRNG